MRRLALAVAVLLTGCHHEPSFDERYAKAEKAINSEAASIDSELASRAALRAEASGTATPAPTEAASPPKS
jgi:hypothetical protein